jgi:menaquinone-dependent protoporphyrinogen oxidase
MPDVLIVHGSKYGQTAKIAEYIANVLRSERIDATVMHADDVPPELDVGTYAGIIVGAPVFVQKHPRSVRRFILHHRSTLDHRLTGFFSVSGSAGGKELSDQVAARSMLTEFLDDCRWQPAHRACFAGAIAFTKYNFLVKWVMKRIARHAGASTDTSRDHEFTNWHAVTNFASEFAAELLKGTQGPTAAVRFPAWTSSSASPASATATSSTGSSAPEAWRSSSSRATLN